ncbi:diguanylate cyclase [Pseudomonas schmalbachii]|uniref:diguanylate cyclase n=1 Tax=Pseudomonas schmalbachii TaxID=2816993 RepID=A0ABS3TU84_9PSED|nr:diguanylate cyclase [Pseudomonas schmalbachii]MBO3277234.1 diguanylate cyclase [Pseudomonas schmalbachii]
MEIRAGKGVSFARRIYLPRAVGLGVGFFCVLAAMYPLQVPSWVWALLVFNGFVWPHVAFQVSRLSKTPFQAERRNLLIDSVFGGFWAGAMQFNPLPTVTVLAMMAMNNIAAGGLRFFLKGTLAQGAGILLSLLVFPLAFNQDVTPLQVYACLPMLVLYPLMVGWVSYRLATKLHEHKQVLRTVSRTDSLTGLLNHASWMAQLDSEFDRCRHLHRRATIALIDIDHFKTINDGYGHVIGDLVLTQLSQILRVSLRETDSAGRYGGDEFCVILPDTSEAMAVDIMERLRQAFARAKYELEPGLAVSLSIGIASYSPYQTDACAWLKEADRALYAAKSGGRDRVSAAFDVIDRRSDATDDAR